MSNEQKMAEAVKSLHAAVALLYYALPYTSLVGGQQAQRDIALHAGTASELIEEVLRSLATEEGK